MTVTFTPDDAVRFAAKSLAAKSTFLATLEKGLAEPELQEATETLLTNFADDDHTITIFNAFTLTVIKLIGLFGGEAAGADFCRGGLENELDHLATIVGLVEAVLEEYGFDALAEHYPQDDPEFHAFNARVAAFITENGLVEAEESPAAVIQPLTVEAIVG